ncbi:Zinc finger CCCH domain-containing protein 33 [Hordeum vulgare]|nr:Zinc finger CCCH domain-containing protein 33 [Hordeum vulgare]
MALAGEHANCLIKCPGNFTTLLTNYSYWGSPGGKLDWGVQGDELHKFRKSASFGFRGQSAMLAATAATAAEPESHG